jgi:glycosyltransferase involved in cell wall biosynthesis
MNILYVTYAYLPSLGGVQRSVHNLAAEFVRRGHRVFIATDGAKPLAYERVTPAPVFSFRIPYPFCQPRLQRAKAALLDSVNLTALACLCLKNRIEIAHCHLINVDTRYAIALQRWLGIKVVITLRGGEFHHWIANHPVRREYVRRMLESADAVTALSQSQMDDAKALAPDLTRETLVISNPADPEAIVRQASQGAATDGEPYILFSGRLEDQKRVDLLIEAYHGIVGEATEYPYDLVVAGSGSLLPALQEQARNGPGASRIHFRGPRRYEDSLALIRDAAALVLPSQESEGCPNVVLEAMALGTPVIVSDHGPLPELVEHRVNGEVFASGDAAALKNRLCAIGLGQEKRARYAAAGLRHLEEKHRFGRIADAYEELYRRLTIRSRTSGNGPA